MRALFAIALATGCVDDGGPRLDTVTPTAAGRGVQVMLFGSRLCGADANCATAGGRVQLGLNPPVVIANVIEYSDTAAVIEIPLITDVGPTDIVVTVNEHASNALAFEVL
jgi:hypothetical protein